MKKQLFILSFALLFSIRSYAQVIDSADSSNTKILHTNPRTYLPLLIDPGFTIRSGAEDIITLHKGVASLEDKLIGFRWFSESSILGKVGGIAARFARYALLDIPMDYFSIVFAHEYFGHGARYRELNMSDIHYGFDMPPPYGSGGGQASNYLNVSISTHELLAIWEGGIEVHSIINRKLSQRWMAKNTINYREASQYFWSFQIMMRYIQDTAEDLADGIKDDDPRAYVRIINAHSGYTDVNNLKMSVKDLKSKMIINSFNPFVFYSLYSILKTFLFDGKSSYDIPTLSLGAVDYLPSLRAGLNPFGVEYHFENYLRYKNVNSLIDISYGDQAFFNSWGGVGVSIQNIYGNQQFSFDMHLNMWHQPEIQLGGNPTVNSGGAIGGAFSVRGHYDYPEQNYPISAVLELGYKSPGFLEGYNLASSPILMIGLALRR